jgi:hypothetical protein
MSEEFMRTFLLPRLDQLEAEVKALREVTWPVCQALLEEGDPLKHTQEKRKFLKMFYKDEAIDLLLKKAAFERLRENEAVINQEFDMICTLKEN